jgi:hypothetical protein
VTDPREKLLQYIDEALRETTEPPPVTVPEEPSYLEGRYRRMEAVPPQEAPMPDAITVEEARERLRGGMAGYLADIPSYMLLVKALPGVGKTTAAVWAAEQLIREGRRVMYAGPRHDFYDEGVSIADNPELWYHWLPRQLADEATGKIETCPHTEQINLWLTKGYPGIEFCKRICGWDVINRQCVYHAQKKTKAPVVYCQHQHVTLGHPLQFDVVIGDEDPIQTFCHEWEIPADGIELENLEMTNPLAHILHQMYQWASGGLVMEGDALIRALGDPASVREACEEAILPANVALYVPPIHYASDVERVPYAHLQALCVLLAREARAVERGQEYPHRVLIGNHKLTLLLRRAVHEEMPYHIIWLDATANPRLYESCFGRKVKVIDAQPKTQARIFQVHDRANGKGSLFSRTKEEREEAKQEGKPAPTPRHAQQLVQVLDGIVQRYGYTSPAITGFKDFLAQNKGLRKYPQVSFYAGRGSNALEGHDALFVLGTPMPPTSAIEYSARMIFWERMTPFQVEWSTKRVPYAYIAPDGMGRAYPVSGFWGDPDLQSLLWSWREAEIIQMAHRGRPVNHPIDIWLLTNIPVTELPPNELLSTAEALGAPEGTNPYLWARVEALAREQEVITIADIVERLKIERRAAGKYIDLLVQTGHWEKAAIKSGRRGRPQAAARRKE